jgi:hypothetical protein
VEECNSLTGDNFLPNLGVMEGDSSSEKGIVCITIGTYKKVFKNQKGNKNDTQKHQNDTPKASVCFLKKTNMNTI